MVGMVRTRHQTPRKRGRQVVYIYTPGLGTVSVLSSLAYVPGLQTTTWTKRAERGDRGRLDLFFCKPTIISRALRSRPCPANSERRERRNASTCISNPSEDGGPKPKGNEVSQAVNVQLGPGLTKRLAAFLRCHISFSQPQNDHGCAHRRSRTNETPIQTLILS